MFVIYSCSNSDEEIDSSEGLSPYELKRLENIARNKRKLEEIFGTRTDLEANSNTKQAKKKKVFYINISIIIIY